MSDLWIDFNDVASDGRTCSLLKFAAPGVTPRVGGIYRGGDYDGNTALATVVAIKDNGLIELMVNRESFEAGE